MALFLCSITVFAQENNIKHTIVKGETISSIAQKYNVSIASIYQLNPKAKKTLQLNQVLLIPNSESKKDNNSESLATEQTTEINHQVVAKETLYGITKQFKTTKELLYKANPKLESEGLKIGQIIIIPSSLTQKKIASLSNSKVEETIQNTEPLTHEVKPKESLYAIAKEYGLNLKELQNANPNIGKKGLSIGQVIIIPSNGKLNATEVVVVEEEVSKTKEKEKEAVSVIETKPAVSIATESSANETKVVAGNSKNQTSEISHVVLTKETKYGIAKKYGITVAELETQNPVIKQKLEVGVKLSIQVPNNADVLPEIKHDDVAVTQIQTQQTGVEKKQDSTTVKLPIANEDLINQLIESASDKIGTRYRSGGTTTAGFDCSGLMCFTFGAFDIKLPRSSIEQSAIGEKIDDYNAQKGDLIFFKTNGRSQINHVGMVIEVTEDEIKFIHSSTHSGVIISSTKEPYYLRNFAQVNRVIK